MRVVRIVTRLNRGGPLRQLRALVPGLARLGIEGPVWVGAPAAGEEDASDDLRALGVRVEVVPGLGRALSPPADLRAWRWIQRHLVREAPDVVHTHLAKAGALGRTAARSARVAATVHTFHGHHFEAPFPRGLAARWAERALAGATDAAVCLSESQRRDVVERFRVLPAGRVAVVAPGIDVEDLRRRGDPDSVARLRARIDPDGRPLVLWLGRFVAAKAPERLLDAIAGVPAGTLRLVLAGDGPLRRAVERSAARRGLSDRVEFVGAVEDPGTWIAAADVVALSSRSEGTPIALVEAMALGRAVVSPSVGGVADVVDDGRTGLLVPPGDAGALGAALSRLAADPDLRRRLGAEGARTAQERFGARRLVDETAALYRRVLTEGCRAAAAR